MTSPEDNFLARVNEIHSALNIPQSFATDRKLPLQLESHILIDVICEGSEKQHKLSPRAAEAWAELDNAARRDGIKLVVVSSYRSLDYQKTLIEKKLAQGQNILDILSLLAPPGYSEHHTGRALDLTTDDCPPCVERFEDTKAFLWLQNHAAKFGFSMSYPRANPFGFVYEPWHWAFTEN